MNADTTKPDKLGRAFDPRKFRPKLDSLGRWVNRLLGRKPKHPKTPATVSQSAIRNPQSAIPMSTTPSTSEPPPGVRSSIEQTDAVSITPANAGTGGGSVPASTATPSFADIDAAARAPDASVASDAAGGGVVGAKGDGGDVTTTCETIIGVIQTALVLIGEDEGVLSAQEKLLIRRPLERVLKKYNVGDVLPCEVDLAVALAIVVIARLKKPKTATTFARLKAWFQNKIAKRRGAKLAAQVTEATK